MKPSYKVKKPTQKDNKNAIQFNAAIAGAEIPADFGKNPKRNKTGESVYDCSSIFGGDYAYTPVDLSSILATAGNYPVAEYLEKKLQRQCMTWLSNRKILAFHVPNEFVRTGWGAVQMKLQGVYSGVPDIIVISAPKGTLQPRGVAVELKVKGGKVTPPQEWWLKELHKAGWTVAVAWSMEEFVAVMESLGF